ncbi:MAG: ATP-binding protein [Candidatus Gastranaerophilales bacterium]|nr:ATP-binding protein [Candidatus Gastranaerophilales bacterium]
MHNCIAHQDYSLNKRIIVTEKIDKLIFSNAGSFYEGNPEDYSKGDKTPESYRNTWLTYAMLNLGMIDRLGYGIHNIYLSQRNRFFPLPDYVLSEKDKVILKIYGHTIDENYSKLLIERKDLPLDRVVLLDKVQKNLEINDNAAKALKTEKLIEGRKPNYYIAASIAEAINDKAAYIKNRAFDDEYYKKMIEAFLDKFKTGTRQDFEELIIPKLSDVLTGKQKKDKVKNILQAMKRDNIIRLNGREWIKI